MTIVKIEGIRDNIMDISGIDMLDNTPLLDIKPYIPDFDIRKDAKSGWIHGKKVEGKKHYSDDRFSLDNTHL